MRISISKLKGKVLDWAIMQLNSPSGAPHQQALSKEACQPGEEIIPFSTDGRMSVPLLEKYKITTTPGRRGDADGNPTGWTAWAYGYEDLECEGDTLLEAGLRCILSIELESMAINGEIDIPWAEE